MRFNNFAEIHTWWQYPQLEVHVGVVWTVSAGPLKEKKFQMLYETTQLFSHLIVEPDGALAPLILFCLLLLLLQLLHVIVKLVVDWVVPVHVVEAAHRYE